MEEPFAGWVVSEEMKIIAMEKQQEGAKASSAAPAVL